MEDFTAPQEELDVEDMLDLFVEGFSDDYEIDRFAQISRATENEL